MIQPHWLERQFNEWEAKDIYNSGLWTKWTDDEIVRLQLFQVLVCLPFARFQEALEKILGRGIWTTEFLFEHLHKEYLTNHTMPTVQEIMGLVDGVIK